MRSFIWLSLRSSPRQSARRDVRVAIRTGLAAADPWVLVCLKLLRFSLCEAVGGRRLGRGFILSDVVGGLTSTSTNPPQADGGSPRTLRWRETDSLASRYGRDHRGTFALALDMDHCDLRWVGGNCSCMGHERGDCALNGPRKLAVLGAGTSGTTQKVPTPVGGPNLRVGCGRPCPPRRL